MKKCKNLAKYLVILIAIFLVACEEEILLEQSSLTEVISVNSLGGNTNMEIYNLYLEDEYELSKFEPISKIYSGIQLEQQNSGFVGSFENFSEVNQNVYLRDMAIDEIFPISWVLGCYSNGKAPFINLLPPNEDLNIYSEEFIISRAKEFGKLDIPIFLNVYTLSERFLEEKEDYISFIQNMKNYFEIYSPNVSIVWCIDQRIAYKSREFYPGDDYIDWVGVDIYEDIDDSNTLNIMFNELDFIYNEFSDKKPIFINLRISHFGNSSYTYNIDAKLKELYRFYNELPYKYPRLKMINYINIDTFNSTLKNKQNYLITDNKQILEKYREILGQDIYSDVFVYLKNAGKTSIENKKLNVLCYKVNNEFFVKTDSLEMLEYNQNFDKFNINGQYFNKLDDILTSINYTSLTDEINKNIIIKLQ